MTTAKWSRGWYGISSRQGYPRWVDPATRSIGVELIPSDEPERLAAIRRYDILDTPADGAFDRLTSLAARLFEVPISIISIVDHDRIWFKSHYGIDAEQIDRDPGLCASAILQHEPWLVSDAKIDPRTLTNPLVCGQLGLRFYAGIPLKTSDGFNLGTFNIIDVKPRELTEEEIRILEDLATFVVHELELRLASRRLASSFRDNRRRALELNDDVVQGLAAARLALELEDSARTGSLIDKTLVGAQQIVSGLLQNAATGEGLAAGDLVRSSAALSEPG